MPGPSSEHRWRERGLDRLVSRTVSVTTAEDAVTVSTRTGAASSDQFVDVVYRWQLLGAELELTTEITPVDRLGLHLAPGRGPVRTAPRARPGGLVRTRAAGVLPGFGNRRAWSAGTPPASPISTSATPGRRRPATGPTCASWSCPPATDAEAAAEYPARTGRAATRLHLHPLDPSGTRPGPAPVRVGAAEPDVPVPRRRRPRTRLAGLRHRRAAEARAVAERPRVHRPVHRADRGLGAG